MIHTMDLQCSIHDIIGNFKFYKVGEPAPECHWVPKESYNYTALSLVPPLVPRSVLVKVLWKNITVKILHIQRLFSRFG